jgi:hypothetical protein
MEKYRKATRQPPTPLGDAAACGWKCLVSPHSARRVHSDPNWATEPKEDTGSERPVSWWLLVATPAGESHRL